MRIRISDSHIRYAYSFLNPIAHFDSGLLEYDCMLENLADLRDAN